MRSEQRVLNKIAEIFGKYKSADTVKNRQRYMDMINAFLFVLDNKTNDIFNSVSGGDMLNTGEAFLFQWEEVVSKIVEESSVDFIIRA